MSESNNKNKAKLRELVKLLPLDKWQSVSVGEDVDRLPDHEVEEITKDLEKALLELPRVVAKFDNALAKARQKKIDNALAKGRQQELQGIILQAFPNEQDLEQELLFRLDISYQNEYQGGNYKARVTNIITKYFEAAGNKHTTQDLLDALIIARPRNEALKSFGVSLERLLVVFVEKENFPDFRFQQFSKHRLNQLGDFSI